MFKILYVLLLLSILSIFAECKQLWHTSQVALNKLFDLQMEQFDAFKNYLDLETNRLEKLNNNLTVIYEWRNFTADNKDIYLYNHINDLKVISHIHNQLSIIEYLTNNKESVEVLNVIDNNRVVNENDITLASSGLRRLQIFYDIPAIDMAAGFYNKRNIGDELDACECYVMLSYCLEKHDMYGVLEWANETYNKWIKNGRPNCVDIDLLYLYSISSSMYTGFSFSSLYNTNINNELKDIQHVSHYISLMKNDILECDLADIFNRYNIFNTEDIEKSRDLCKHGVTTRTLTKNLICQYDSKNSYFHILMPFKEEYISNDPLVRIYHDVIYENEIINVKSIIKEYMTEAKVLKKTNSILNEISRSGQVAWMPREIEVKNFSSLNTRIELITKCTTMTAERYQIVNYGLGGHYTPHIDAFQFSEHLPIIDIFGNRLVTVLFYLNDVLDDGFTSFPNLNVISPSEKGAAIVWYSLHTSNGSRHADSLHASCPILKGNKWIMTKWLHEEGQDLPYNWKKKYNN